MAENNKPSLEPVALSNLTKGLAVLGIASLLLFLYGSFQMVGDESIYK